MRRLSKEQVAEIEQLVQEGRSIREVAIAVGVHYTTVREIAHGRHYHQQPRNRIKRRNYLPTIEEIEADCERFLRECPRLPVGFSGEYEFPHATIGGGA